MVSRLRKFFALQPARRRLLSTAFRELYRARRDLRHAPLRELLRGLGAVDRVEQAPLAEAQRECARAIGWAVAAAARHAPWQSTCLAQVLAARSMLVSKGISGAVFIGAAQDEPIGRELFGAHAWLTSGGEFVTGEAGHERFTVIAVHRW